jgi:magnesium transporter
LGGAFGGIPQRFSNFTRGCGICMDSAETPVLTQPGTPRAARRAVGGALDEHFELDPDFVERVAAALRADDKEQVQALVGDLHYADIADLLERLDTEDRRLLVDAIRHTFNPDVLPELAAEVRDEVMDALGFEDLAYALRELDSDDAVYVAGKLDPQERSQLLARMPPDTRKLIEAGIGYAEHSAGRLMQRELVAAPSYWTVGETIDFLRSGRKTPEKFYAVYVVDQRHRPLGVVELHRVLKAKRPEFMRDLIDPEIQVISVETDREEVAHLFRQRDLTAAPVVDKSGRLVGQITIDDVVDVMEAEHSEDILKMAGVRSQDDATLYRSVMSTAQTRFIWLVVNLGTAFLASSVIGVFEESIAKLSALAVLMPICASMGGNAGTQTLATVIRSLATRELNQGNVMRVVTKEFFIGSINGLLFAAITGLFAWVWFKDPLLGVVIGSAMIANMIAAGLAGITIPVILEKLGADPADSAVVFLTTVTDCVGFFSFLGLATWIML